MTKGRSEQELIREFGQAVVWIGLILVSTVLFRAYRKWVNHSKVFAIERVEIEGNELLSDERIRSMTRLQNGLSIWSIDLETAEKAIESVGYIDEVVVKRKLPDVVQVQIKEKKPIALLRHQNNLYCIDPEGQVLPSEPGKMYDLPVISGDFRGDVQMGQKVGGQWVPKGLNILKSIRYDRPNLFLDISEMILENEQGILIRLCQYGIPVYIGEDMTWWKLRCFDAILRELTQKGELRMTKYIDLRYRSQIYVGRRS